MRTQLSVGMPACSETAQEAGASTAVAADRGDRTYACGALYFVLLRQGRGCSPTGVSEKEELGRRNLTSPITEILGT